MVYNDDFVENDISGGLPNEGFGLVIPVCRVADPSMEDFASTDRILHFVCGGPHE